MLHDLFQKTRPQQHETKPEAPTSTPDPEPAAAVINQSGNGAADPEACGNCEYWFRYQGSKRGSCRRYPPAPATADPIDPSRLTPGHFPQTREDLWCGEYHPRPV